MLLSTTNRQSDVINDWGLKIKHISMIPLVSVRLIATGLFVMNILAFYSLVSTDDSSQYVRKVSALTPTILLPPGDHQCRFSISQGGYLTLSKNSSMVPLWLALIPPMFLTALGLFISLVLYK